MKCKNCSRYINEFKLCPCLGPKYPVDPDSNFLCGDFKPISEADKIRAMSDEELAVLFAKTHANLYKAYSDGVSCRTSAVEENLEWLQQQVQEE